MAEGGNDEDVGSPKDNGPDWAEQPSGVALANLSHELKTPLGAILGLSSLLAREPSLSEKGRRRVEAIERSGQHLLHLVDAFLEASATHARELQVHLSPASTVSLVEDVVAMFESDARIKGIELSFRLASDTPSHVLADNGKIRQVLINLVGNAVKFTKRGGVRVLVKASNLHEDDCTLQIEVMDTGPGIAPDELKGIFGRYARGTSGEDVEGVGLGLAISKHNARLLGGTLSVESRVGRGSVFRLEVPVTWLHYAELESPAPTISEFPEPPSHQSGTFQKHLVDVHLDDHVVDTFLAAARAGDQSQLFRLTDQLTDEPVSSQLRLLIESYDYEGLMDLLSPGPKVAGEEH